MKFVTEGREGILKVGPTICRKGIAIVCVVLAAKFGKSEQNEVAVQFLVKMCRSWPVLKSVKPEFGNPILDNEDGSRTDYFSMKIA